MISLRFCSAAITTSHSIHDRKFGLPSMAILIERNSGFVVSEAKSWTKIGSSQMEMVVTYTLLRAGITHLGTI